MQRMHLFTVAGLVAAFTAVTAAQAQKTTTPASSADVEFVQKAAAAGKMEVEHGKMAASKASNAQVKAFAQALVKDHTAANQQLMAIAKRKNITITDQPGGMRDSRAGGTADTTTPATKAGGKPAASGSTTGTTGASGGVVTTGERDRQTPAGSGQQTELWMSATGAAFDRGFIQAQMKAHQDAIDLFEKQANGNGDSELKAFAQKQLPGLRNHLKQAQDLQGKLGSTN